MSEEQFKQLLETLEKIVDAIGNLQASIEMSEKGIRTI
jgi:hypothetical protein